MVEKFLHMSKQFIQVFGCEQDLQNIEFTENGQTFTYLSFKYQSVKVYKMFKAEIDSMVNNPDFTASAVFRRIVQTIISDEATWKNGNREKLFEEYGHIIYAAFGEYNFN